MAVGQGNFGRRGSALGRVWPMVSTNRGREVTVQTTPGAHTLVVRLG